MGAVHYTAWACGESYNHRRSAELLIKFGAIVGDTAKDGSTPLHWICANNREASAKLLLENHCPTGELGVSLAA